MGSAARAIIEPASLTEGEMASHQKPTRNRSADEIIEQIRTALAESWLPAIYSRRVLTIRNRSYEFPAVIKNAAPVIQHTLLGIELKIGRRRILCPDLATARYLSVFARAACARVAIPYDITQISHLADELESAWHRQVLLADSLTPGRSDAFRTRVQRRLIDKVQTEITAAGAGTRIPEFKQSTKQNRR
jgi:hypothetical protein